MTLRLRVLLVLLLALLAVQLLSFVAVGWSRGSAARHLANDLIAADLRQMQARLAALPPAARADALPALQRASHQGLLLPSAPGAASDDGLLADLARRVAREPLASAAAIPSAVQAVQWQGAPALWLPLDADQGLLAVFVQGLPRSAPGLAWVLGYGLVVTAVVGLVAWGAVNLATRPLARAAAAARVMTEQLPGPALDESGPPEVRGLARSLNALRGEVQRQLASRTQILAAVAHDLKTPITRMQLRVAALPDDDTRRRLQADLDAMASLVAEGLAYARSEHLNEALVPLDLNALIENVVEPMLDLGHDCRYTPSAMPPVRAAPQALTRLLQNLVDNAVRYGGLAELEARVVGGEVELTVADRGPGMPAADLERMFEPFVRGEPSRARHSGGSGLGLAIARNLAQAHGGWLRLEPRDGGGLLARLRWPGVAVAQPAS